MKTMHKLLQSINPATARGQELPPTIYVAVVRVSIMNALGLNTIRRALGPIATP
jgi:hypothetical protein